MRRERLAHKSYPAVYSHKAILSNLHPVIDQHCKEGHMGASHVLTAVRQRYQIVKGNSSAGRVIRRCAICHGANACQTATDESAALEAEKTVGGGSPPCIRITSAPSRFVTVERGKRFMVIWLPDYKSARFTWRSYLSGRLTTLSCL